MNKIKLAGATTLALSVAAVMGIAAGILMVHGPANAPTLQQAPAGFVQSLDAGTTTTDAPTATTATTTDPTPVDEAPSTTTQDAPAAPPATTNTPVDPPADTTTGSPVEGVHTPPPTQTTPVTTSPNCEPDGTGATVCN